MRILPGMPLQHNARGLGYHRRFARNPGKGPLPGDEGSESIFTEVRRACAKVDSDPCIAPKEISLADRQYRWLVVAYTLLMQAVTVGILIYCFALFAVPWLELFDAPRRDVMLAITALQIMVGLVSPFMGRAMDSIPMRYLVSGGALLLGAGLWLVAHAEALWQILLVYGTLFPLAMALTGTLAAQTLVARWFADKRGMAIGISAMGTNLGGVVFPLVVANGLGLLGWREMLEWLALAAVVLVIPLGWLILRRVPEPAQAGGPVPSAVQSRVWQSREILASSMFWTPVLSMVPLTVAFGAVQFNLGVYSQDVGLTGEQAGSLIALCSGCMILGKLFFGGLGDRLDHRYLYWISAASMSAALAILIVTPGFWLLVLGVVLVGLAGGGILPLMGVIYGARFGAVSFGRVMGFVMLSLTLGAFGPFVAGWAYDQSGSYNSAFAGFLALFLPGMLLMRRLPDPATL